MQLKKQIRRSITTVIIASLTMTLGTMQASADTLPPVTGLTSVLETEPEPVRDTSGAIVGYRVSPEVTEALARLQVELQQPAPPTSSKGEASSTQVEPIQVVQCTAAVAAFIGLTVFPTARAAKVAVRLAGYVQKYGAKKVVAIMTRTYKGANKDKLFIEFAKELAGVGALEVCWK